LENKQKTTTLLQENGRKFVMGHGKTFFDRAA